MLRFSGLEGGRETGSPAMGLGDLKEEGSKGLPLKGFGSARNLRVQKTTTSMNSAKSMRVLSSKAVQRLNDHNGYLHSFPFHTLVY